MNTNQIINQSTSDLLFQSKTLPCLHCGNDFSFSADEQKFYYNHGFVNEPKRCPNCRVERRMNRKGLENSTVAKVNCAECEKETTVPFLPMQGRPVYCSTCFIKHGRSRKIKSSRELENQ